MAKKLFDNKLSEPISPLIDVVVNALAAIFIILMIYMIVVRPSDDIEQLQFLDNVKPPGIIQGQSYTYTLPVTGGSGKRTFKLIDGKLPDGLMLDNDNGTIYGVILGNDKINDKRQFSLTIEVSDAKNKDTLTSTFNIYPYAIPYSPAASSFKILNETKSLPPTRIGSSYETIIGAIGGIEPYSWDIIDGNLPQGLELTKNGEIIGFPKTAGLYKFKIRATHSTGSFTYKNIKYEWSGRTAEKNYQLYISESFQHKLYLPVGQVGEPYFGMVIMNNAVVGDHIKWNYKVDGLLSENSIIQGTPLEEGTYDIAYQVLNGEKVIGEGKENLSILSERPKPKVITSFYHGWIDEPLSCGISYEGFREPIKVVPLEKIPDGLEIKDAKVIGVPRSISLYEIPLRVEDQIGNKATGTIYIRIEPKKSPLKFDLPENIYAIVNKPFNKELTALGGSREYIFSLKGELPSSLNFNANNIKGILKKSGKWDVEISLEDIITHDKISQKTTIYSTYEDETTPRLQTDEVPYAIIGKPYKCDLASLGGVGYINFDFEGTLPNGLIFSKTGISGIPQQIETKNFTVTLVDEVGQKAGPYELKISVVPSEHSVPVILTKSIPIGVYGKDYQFNFSAEGGVGKYTWNFHGELPSGLNFTKSGIAGIVKEIKNKNWIINALVADEIGQKSDQIELGLTTIFSDETTPQLQTLLIPNAILGEHYELILAGDGGIGHLKLKFSGLLPDGLNFTESGISGIPERIQKTTFTANLIDEVGNKSELREYTISVVPSELSTPIVLTNYLPIAIHGQKYTLVFAAEGGIGKYKWTFSGKLPEGLRFTEVGIDGVLKDKSNSKWPISIIVKDEIGQSSEKVELELSTYNIKTFKSD